MLKETNWKTKTILIAGIATFMALSVIITIPNLSSNKPQITKFIPKNTEPTKITPPKEPVKNQLTISFSRNSSSDEQKKYLASIGAKVVSEIKGINTVTVEVNEKIAAKLPQSKIIAKSEPNYLVSIAGSEPSSYANTSIISDFQVNDPRFAEQWGVDVIGAKQAWASLPEKVNDIKVAVIDSGICADHPDLKGKVINGFDFVENDSIPQDELGHGCEVAGIIAADLNNNLGIAGIAPNAKIMPLKVLDKTGLGTYSNVAAAIVYAVDNGAKIINLSLGGTNASSVLEDAVNYAKSKNVIIVAAAGNTGSTTVLYPAAYDSVIAVGSVDENLARSSFSSFGSKVDIYAPGRDILSTSLNGDYNFVSGTSFAAPEVAGIEAMDLATQNTLALDQKIAGFGGNKVLGVSTISSFTAITKLAADTVTTESLTDKNNNLVNNAIIVGEPCELPSTYTNQGRNHDADGFGSYNNAVDIGKTICTSDKVIASISGTIKIDTLSTAGCSSSDITWPYNPRISITSDDGNIKVVYLHQNEDYSTFGIHDGDHVTAGQQLATIGNKGCATGPHIHFEVYRNTVNSFQKQSYSQWAFNLPDIQTSNFVDYYEETGYKGLGYLLQAKFNSTGVQTIQLTDMPYWFDNKAASVYIGNNECTFMYLEGSDSVQFPALTNYDENQWANTTVWYKANASIPDLSTVNWKMPGTNNTIQKMNHDVSAAVIGRPCNASGQSISSQGIGCFADPFSQSTTTTQGDSMQFVSDVTIPDNTQIQTGSAFTKTWRVQNTGTTTWGAGYTISFESGYQMSAPSSVTLNQVVAPGATADISVNMTTPVTEGTYRGNWRLKNPSGQTFGVQLYVLLIAKSTASPVSTTSGQVKLYALANYANQIGTYGTGTFNDPSGNSFSIDIPSGWSVRAYKADNLSGETTCWYQSVPNLQDTTWQNAIQSIQVFNYNDCGNGQKVKLYSAANYQNLLGQYDPGKTNDPNHTSFSLDIPTGWSVKVYSQDNETGSSNCYNSSQHDLTDTTWNLRIESMEVFTTDVCPSTASYVRICRQTGGTDCMDITTESSYLGDIGFGNDTLKSIYIAGGWDVVLFEDVNYGGRSFETNGSINDLGGIPFGYGTTSIQLRKTNSPAFTLYKLGDYNDGGPFSSDRSIHNLQYWKADQGSWNDKAESMRISSGYEIIGCTDAEFHGNCGRTKNDVSDLNALAQGLRDGLSSVQVCPGSCPASPVNPVLMSPIDNTSFLPGGNVSFAWSGNGDQYYIEVWGGALTSPMAWGWDNITQKTFALPASSQPYYWHVKSWNPYGESNWSAQNTFYVKDIGPSSTYLFGSNSANLSQDTSYTVYVNPSDAANLNFVWSPAPKSGQGSATAIYNWINGGSQNISVTVSNTGGSSTSSKAIAVGCPTGEYLTQYYNNNTLYGSPFISVCEKSVDHNWGSDGPKFAQDGDLTVDLGQTAYTDNVRTSLAVTANSGGTVVTLAGVDGFKEGDEILIIQMTEPNSGLYETQYIQSIVGNSLNLVNTLANTFTVGGLSKAQVVKVPHYNNVDIKGILTAHPWDGNSGGIIAFKSTGNTIVESTGKIDASGLGFKGGRGGYKSNASQPDTGSTGGSIASDTPLEGTTGGDCGGCMSPPSPDDLGGGHGGRGSRGGDGASGGAGGSYGTLGQAGANLPYWPNTPGGLPGVIYGESFTDLSRILFGSGGGGGGKGKDGFGQTGGNGGGMIMLFANTIQVDGSITSNGSNGLMDGTGNSGGGGGGAGGAIYIKAKSANINNNIQAAGGRGSNSVSSNTGVKGGDGGSGRMFVGYCDTLSGVPTNVVSSQVSCSQDNFSVRWSRNINLTQGNYNFKITSDDGVRLYVDNNLLIDEWHDGANTYQATSAMSDGNHTIMLEYYEHTGNASINFDIAQLANPAPVINTIPSQTVDEDNPLAPFSLNDYLTYAGNVSDIKWEYSGATNLNVNIDANNTVTITPKANWSGEETITFTATALDQSASTSVLFKANPVNDPPTITSDPVTQATELSVYKYDMIATDVDNTELTYALVQAPDAMTINSQTGEITWTPASNQVKVYDVTVDVSDGTNTTEQKFQVTVTNVNNAPIVITIPGQTIDEDTQFSPIDLNQYVTDADEGDTITWQSSGNANLGIVIDTNSTATITSPKDWNGEETIKFTATDKAGATGEASVVFKVNPINDPPQITSQANTNAFINQEYQYPVKASDVDNQTLNYSLINKPDGMTIDQTGLIKWTPGDSAKGNQNVQVQVSDGSLTADQSYTINVDYSQYSFIKTIDEHFTDLNSWSQSNTSGFNVSIDNESLKINTNSNNDSRKDIYSKWINVDLNKIYYLAGRVKLATADAASISINLYDANFNLIGTAKTINISAGTRSWAEYRTSYKIPAVFNTKSVKYAKIILGAGDIYGTNIAEANTYFDDIWFNQNARPYALFTYSPAIVKEEDTITLDGSASKDPNNTAPLKYSWSQIDGMPITINNADKPIATINTPNIDKDYSITIRLVVNDSLVNSLPIDKTILVHGVVNGLDESFDNENIWRNTNTATHTSSIDNGSLKLEALVAGKASNYLSPYINVDNKDYGLTYKVKTENAKTYILRVRGFDANFKNIQNTACSASGMGGTKDWKEFGCNITMFTTNTVLKYAQVSVEFNGNIIGAKSWTDYIKLGNPGVAPTISQIPDQTIIQGSKFTTIDLKNYASDADLNDILTYSYKGNSKIRVVIDTNSIVTLTYPSTWVGTENITFTVKDKYSLSASTTISFTVNPKPKI